VIGSVSLTNYRLLITDFDLSSTQATGNGVNRRSLRTILSRAQLPGEFGLGVRRDACGLAPSARSLQRWPTAPVRSLFAV
jgi:hypothetical protein